MLRNGYINVIMFPSIYKYLCTCFELPKICVTALRLEPSHLKFYSDCHLRVTTNKIKQKP